MSVIRLCRRCVLSVVAIVALIVVAGSAAPDPHAATADLGSPTLFSPDAIGKILTQGGAAAVLIVVLWSYRRDFLRKNEDKDAEIRRLRDERDMMAAIVKESTVAITNSAVSMARHTDSTHRLARAVETIEKKLE